MSFMIQVLILQINYKWSTIKKLLDFINGKSKFELIASHDTAYRVDMYTTGGDFRVGTLTRGSKEDPLSDNWQSNQHNTYFIYGAHK